MADGMHGEELAEKAPQTKSTEVFIRTDAVLIAASVIAAIALLGGILSILLQTSSGFSLPAHRMIIASVICGVAWPLLLLLRDGDDNFEHGPAARLPIVCLTLLGVLALAVIFGNTFGLPLPSQIGSIGQAEHVFYVFLALALSITPLFVNAINLERLRAGKSDKTSDTKTTPSNGNEDEKNSEAMGALLATVGVLALIGLALTAAIWGETLQLQALYGVTLSAALVGIFGVVIFLEPISHFGPVVALGRGLKTLARNSHGLAEFYQAIDGALVRVGAVMAGMEHRSVMARYCVLAAMLTCLSVLSWYLPAPYGLIPGLLAVTLALSVSRLWAWVEDDRELAAMTQYNDKAPYKTKLREDYRDETLLGFVFLFALMPIIMYQVHHSPIFPDGVFKVPVQSEHQFFDWLGFFGIELAKAVPIVDWAEIYNIGNAGEDPIISMKGPVSQHAVFLARVTVDLVLIAALLQAISISGRNRQQKRLYNAGVEPQNKDKPGLIDRLDPFVEEVELKRAIERSWRKGAKVPFAEWIVTKDSEVVGVSGLSKEEFAANYLFDLGCLNRDDVIDFRRYNEARLFEIHAEAKRPRNQAFVAAIAHQREKFTLKSRPQLLAEWVEKREPEHRLFPLLENVVRDYQEGVRETEVDLGFVTTIMRETAGRSGLRAFKSLMLVLLEEISIDGGVLRSLEALEILDDIIYSKNADEFVYTHKQAVQTMGNLVVRLESTSPDVRIVACERLCQLRGQPLKQGTMMAVVHLIEKLNCDCSECRGPSEDQ